MSSAEPIYTQPSRYDRRTIKRAERAVVCSPFRMHLFDTMRGRRVELKAIAGSQGVKSGYTKRPIIELSAENELLWLIQVGLLRREVDGQGLTDSFRLTPLGRQLVERWQGGTHPSKATIKARVYNAINRWVRLPSWLQ